MLYGRGSLDRVRSWGPLGAVACKRRHMGMVVGRRGMEVPRGTAAHLDKRRPVPLPATAKFASGVAETAIGGWRAGPSGRVASGQLVSVLIDLETLLRAAAGAG